VATIERIIELAERLAKDHRNPGGGGGDAIVGFVEHEVVHVIDDFDDAFDGLLRYQDKEFQVFLNNNPFCSGTPERRRFTAAHEFGHYSLFAHRQGIREGRLVHPSKTGFRSDRDIEREADVFAAHFLVPTGELEARHISPDWGAQEVLDVARHFKTSRICAALRCQDVLAGESAIIVWGERVWQSTDREQWWRMPAKAIHRREEIIQGSATEKLLNGYSGDDLFLQRGTTRAAWFPRVRHGAKANDILIEYAISLGRYGALTLLRPDTSHC